MKRKNKGVKIIGFLLSAFFVILLFFLISAAVKGFFAGNPAQTAADAAYFHVIDVGQGESLLFREGGYTMLIDGGNRGDEDLILGYLKELGVKKIDFLIATHPHADHIGGLPGIIDEMEIGAVYMPEFVSTSSIFEDLLTAIENKNLEIDVPNPGDVIAMKNASATFLGPVKKYDDANNNSIVLKITHGKNSFLTTGDIESVAENDILKSGADLKATLLSVPHHGSKTSSGERFLDAVSPDIAAISCGKDNSYGHPHEVTLNRLYDLGAKIYRTDQMSTLVFESDGSEVKLVSSRGDISGEKTKEPEKSPATKGAADGENEKKDQKGLIYIGNKRSKVLHLSTCNFLPAEQNRITFETRGAGIDLGYKPCPICEP